MNIIEQLQYLYPKCAVSCHVINVSFEEQFNNLSWNDDACISHPDTHENPNPKPTIKYLKDKIPEFELKQAKDEMWKKVKEIQSNLSKPTVSEFAIEEEKSPAHINSLKSKANAIGAQIKNAKTMEELNAIDYSNGWDV